MASVNAVKSTGERLPIFSPKRFLSAAQSWSQTATESEPADGSGRTMGGRGFADVERGTATTVPLALLSALTVRITAGRHFCISMPCDGSKFTHQTSPRCITRFLHINIRANAVRKKTFTPFPHFSVKRCILLNCEGSEIKRVFFQRESLLQQFRYKIAPLSGWNGLLEPLRKHVRDMKKQLHTQPPFLISISISKKSVNSIPPDTSCRADRLKPGHPRRRFSFGLPLYPKSTASKRMFDLGIYTDTIAP